ncbi:MAG TPA: Hsp33 family molecular chaperone HslO [Oligoflexia bacterium]|nr:Hsp33 family molecular chaperone HslO [Oligoflexia bacterium]HMP48747.1 Hsp33 family molecular chaperone HslO [Oligoflexia bacterium]
MFDRLVPFSFEDLPIKGTLVRLDESWKQVLQTRSPEDQNSLVEQILAEIFTAGALLGSSLKMEGSLLIQILGNGPITMLLVEVFTSSENAPLGMRAIAKCRTEEIKSMSISNTTSLIGAGTMSITLEPKQGAQSYQSIVPVNSEQISEIFESYMLQSEQIDTRIIINTFKDHLAGLLLQKLPEEINTSSIDDKSKNLPLENNDPETALQKHWERIGKLVLSANLESTVDTTSSILLQRIFPEDTLRVFEERDVSFQCTCSRKKTGDLLITLGKDDALRLIKEEGSVRVTCEFCGILYEFDSIDTEDLFIHSSISGTSAWKN